MLTHIIRFSWGRMRLAPAVLAALSTMLSTGQALSGQGLTQDAPTEIERARAKADKALAAWEAQRGVEARLFALPPDQAIAEVQRDSRLYDEYLAARQQQVSLLSQAFRRDVEALTGKSVEPGLASLSAAAQEDLATLLQGDLGARDAMAAAEKDPDPGRRAARQQAVERESKAYSDLEVEARKRLELAGLERRTARDYDRNEQALTNILRRVADSLGDDAESYSRERQTWRNYAQDLENLVLRRESGGDAATAKPKPSKPRKPNQKAGPEQ